MKVVILAGGLGSRLSEETISRPKPMVEIGGSPILWHIMKIYSAHGLNDFIICLGYKGYMIKEYFANYYLHRSDVTFDLSNNTSEIHHNNSEPWRVTLVDTGEGAMTGGRLTAIRRYLPEDEPFCFTYGDGVSNIDITALIAFHRRHGKLATVTGVYPPGRFGALDMEGEQVTSFREKPMGDGSWINGGYFVAMPKVLDLVTGPGMLWEKEPMEQLATAGDLMAYRHNGFWHPMDTVRDRMALDEMWTSGNAPWKVW